jgi:hypothetical protein
MAPGRLGMAPGRLGLAPGRLGIVRIPSPDMMPRIQGIII